MLRVTYSCWWVTPSCTRVLIFDLVGGQHTSWVLWYSFLWNIPHSTVFFHPTQDNCVMTTLNLCRCELNSASVSEIQRGLSNNSSLCELNLTGSQVNSSVFIVCYDGFGLHQYRIYSTRNSNNCSVCELNLAWSQVNFFVFFVIMGLGVLQYRSYSTKDNFESIHKTENTSRVKQMLVWLRTVDLF